MFQLFSSSDSGNRLSPYVRVSGGEYMLSLAGSDLDGGTVTVYKLDDGQGSPALAASYAAHGQTTNALGNVTFRTGRGYIYCALTGTSSGDDFTGTLSPVEVHARFEERISDSVVA